MERSELLDLYALAIGEEQHYHKMNQERIAFYSSLYSAVASATAAAAVLAFSPREGASQGQLMALAFLPLLLFVIAGNAVEGVRHVYRRFLEAIALRAKLEQELGLTRGPDADCVEKSGYWKDEPLVGRRHIESRGRWQSSSDFVTGQLEGGYFRVTKGLFRTLQVLSVIALIVVVVATVMAR